MKTQFEPLVEVVRGRLVESVHFGTLVVLDQHGKVTGQVGDPTAVMFPRSSNKLMQAAGMVELGLELPPRLLALVAASHSGGDVHVAGVDEILAGAGLDRSALACTPYLPSGAAERQTYLAAGGSPAAVRSDCSGKHAGMLATCVRQGWPTGGYLDPAHPLQQALRTAVARFADEPVAADSVDGCGAPLWGFSLTGLARAFHHAVVAPIDHPLRQVADAMRAFPENVAGPGREATAAMQSLAGVLAKDGAEAVFALAAQDGRSAAIKIADGGSRAIGPVVAAVLEAWGATDLAGIRQLPVLGGGQPVGGLRLTLAATAALAG